MVFDWLVLLSIIPVYAVVAFSGEIDGTPLFSHDFARDKLIAYTYLNQIALIIHAEFCSSWRN